MTVAVEIAVQDVKGLEVAARHGASRVELCVDLDCGGLTPSADLTRQCVARARELVEAREARDTFDVHVLIRSRPGDFFFHQDEVELMAKQAADAVHAGAAGVVIGALQHGSSASQIGVDLKAIEHIRDAALAAATEDVRGLVLTFHRALDELNGTEQRVDAIHRLVSMGFHRALSSGGAPRVIDGLTDLARMQDAGDGLLDVMAGGGLRPADIRQVLAQTGVRDVHLSARGKTMCDGTLTDPAIVTAAVDAVEGQ
ncbi:copper homeostasis protein CutC [Devriesea agamarum]|uniref:copper homeostasis protein CutC n=1 Tax=Devriesea agamarum TaxID=472569 RepID=UPI00071D051E|nr:copper homeostasis protein CutC [Devriesea agamarum]